MLKTTNSSIKGLLDSQRGITLMEVLITLVILCLFVVVFTQLIGISFKDIFFKGNQMEAAAAAQHVMEIITALAGENSDADFDEAIGKLNGCLVVDRKEELLVYNPGYGAQIFYNRPVSKPITGDVPVTGIDVSVVVFFNNGSSHIKLDKFIQTG